MVVLKMVNKEYVAMWGRKTNLQSNERISLNIYFSYFNLSDYWSKKKCLYDLSKFVLTKSKYYRIVSVSSINQVVAVKSFK